MFRRHYFASRRAYAPRSWLTLIVVVALNFGAQVLLDPGLVGSLILGLALGVGGVRLQWWWWERRHPVITAKEMLDDRRRAAPWN